MKHILENEGLMKCPKCGTVIEKIDGCQFISCMSSECQGRTYLCWDCGKQLNKDHENHKCNPRKIGPPKPKPHVDPVPRIPRRRRRKFLGIRF